MLLMGCEDGDIRSMIQLSLLADPRKYLLFQQSRLLKLLHKEINEDTNNKAETHKDRMSTRAEVSYSTHLSAQFTQKHIFSHAKRLGLISFSSQLPHRKRWGSTQAAGQTCSTFCPVSYLFFKLLVTAALYVNPASQRTQLQGMTQHSISR